uniref:Secreted protein n=1 Tax=Setaria italica TaxID=4555 RepID=K3YKC2_SETIT
MFRIATLLWIILLNSCSAPCSRSPMMHSNACNCSSLQTTTFLFWNALETRDLLGITPCLDTRRSANSRREAATNLALSNSLTSLHSLEVGFLLVFLDCFCAFLTKRMYERTLA